MSVEILSGTNDWHSTVTDLSVARLKKLKALDLSSCGAWKLPEKLGAMSDLESLDLFPCCSFQHQHALD